MPTAIKKPKAKAKKSEALRLATHNVAPRISVIVTNGNYVGALQEAAVREGLAFPTYAFERSGPDHQATYCCDVLFNEKSMSGSGPSKKQAKAVAAESWAYAFGAVAEK